jgi:hypothetical protein
MIYAIAISFCEEDVELAHSIWSAFRAKMIATYFYKREANSRALILDRHLQIYCRSRCRIYLLRKASFGRRFPAFELQCGCGRDSNLVVPLEDSLVANIPNDYLFIHDASWIWLPNAHPVEQSRIIRRAQAILDDE